jgi:uncharacterized phiE125 gp8 family phage protein
MGARRISGPTVEPLTLAQAKAHLRYELDDQDEAIMAFVATARDLVEQRLERPLLTQTWEVRASLSTTTVPTATTTASSPVTPAGGEVTDSHVDDFVHNRLTWRAATYSSLTTTSVTDCGLELYFAAPLASIDTITLDGVALVDAIDYLVDSSVEPARLYGSLDGALVVNYTVGVETADLVPPALLGAVRSMLGILWVYRGQLPPGSEIEAVLASVEPYHVAGAMA